ncbi:type II toxin-antitoxin system HicA family toxin [Nannocystis pusilla]|uniref:Type II toxin-antitoxin system HicA family toxin n=1 Tax=Nannocystis pusilla TaxID=889268 RepID=A0ABS7U4D6_9BACT|nr:type II toxin-antitoxin system HicA family toxin [Nannocystis pusilla]
MHHAVLKRIGFVELRQTGSHIRLVGPGPSYVTVPNHRELRRGTLNQILKQGNISLAEFLAVMRDL